MMAVQTDDAEVFATVLAATPNLSQQDVEGRDALMLAVLSGKIEMAEMLVQAGASLWLKDSEGMTVVDYARITGHRGLEETLASRRATQVAQKTLETLKNRQIPSFRPR